MSVHENTAHIGHEPDEFRNAYALWAVPFSLALLVFFVLIVTLWVPAAASKEMKSKELLGATISRGFYDAHAEEDAEELGNIEASMDAIVRQNDNR